MKEDWQAICSLMIEIAVVGKKRNEHSPEFLTLGLLIICQ